MREVGGQSELWLIKAGDRIVGPFEHAEVIKRLLSREIAVIDEISKPMSRWRYVREEPAFLSVVEQIRSENLNTRDDTVATVTTTAVDPLDLTPTPTQVDHLMKTVESTHREESIPAKRYGLQKEERSVQLAPAKSNLPLIAAALLVAALAAFWYFKTTSQRVGVLQASFSTLKRSGLNAINAGDYRDALLHLREAQNVNSGDVDVQVSLAAMLLKVEGQTAAARRIISDVLASPDVSPENKKKSDVILSYADLLENEPARAVSRLAAYTKIEDELDRVIAFNKSVALEATKQSREAKLILQPILSDPKYGPPSRLLLAIMTADSNQEIAVENIRPVIDGGDYRPRPFQQEALVIQAYLQMKAQNTKTAEAAITAALTEDPYATGLFSYAPSLYLQAINWAQLRKYCQAIERGFPKSVEATTLLAVCELKSDRQARALELMDNALAQAPQDQLLLANNAFLLLEFGKDDEAKGSLRLAMRSSDSLQTLLLMARACGGSRDAICERESYKKVLHLDPRHLTALVGLAELELRAGDAEAALQHYKQAMTIDPSFAPLLRLKEKLP